MHVYYRVHVCTGAHCIDTQQHDPVGFRTCTAVDLPYILQITVDVHCTCRSIHVCSRSSSVRLQLISLHKKVNGSTLLHRLDRLLCRRGNRSTPRREIRRNPFATCFPLDLRHLSAWKEGRPIPSFTSPGENQCNYRLVVCYY